MRAFAVALASLFLLTSIASAATEGRAQAPFQQWQRLGSMRASGAVAISADGQIVVVGDSIAEPCQGGECRGVAAIFVRSGARWRRAQRLAPTNRPPRFGESVAVSATGDVVVVGAYRSFDDDSLAAVYVFVRVGTSWKIGQTLTVASSDRRFGGSVAVSSDGRTIVVGDEAGSSLGEGVAHVYVRSGSAWDEKATLHGRPGPADFTFGDTVAVSGDGRTILVLSADTGFVFAHANGAWLLEASLVPTEERASLTTATLSPDGHVAVLTDDDVSSNVSGPGRAYVFVKAGSTWRKAQTIVEPGRPRAWNGFGEGVAASRDGHTLLVGAPLTDGSGLHPYKRGVVYVFGRIGRRTWKPTQRLGTTRGLFDLGASVATTPDASRIVVGSLDPAFVLSR
jgi:hypothetical protein